MQFLQYGLRNALRTVREAAASVWCNIPGSGCCLDSGYSHPNKAVSTTSTPYAVLTLFIFYLHTTQCRNTDLTLFPSHLFPKRGHSTTNMMKGEVCVHLYLLLRGWYFHLFLRSALAFMVPWATIKRIVLFDFASYTGTTYNVSPP